MVGAAIVGSTVVGGALSSRAQRKAAKNATQAQLQAQDQASQVQKEMFEETKRILSPYVDAGIPALQQMAGYAEIGPYALERQAAISGLMGPEAQAAMIAEIESDPLYQATVRQGEEAILQQASATGGLRGGNIQGALAQFRPQMLRQEIENMYGRMGGLAGFGYGVSSELAGIGQASAAGQAAAGRETGANLGNLLVQGGQARAQGALAKGAATAGMYGGIVEGVTAAGTAGLF